MLAEIETIYIQLLDMIMEDTVIILRLNQQIMGYRLSEHLLTNWTYDDNNWHHLAVTVDNTAKNLQLYIDGKLYSSKKLSGNIDISNITSFHLGDKNNNDGLAEHIYYDDVRIFDQALTPSEIRSLAHSNVSQRNSIATPLIDPTFDLSSVFSDPNSNDTLTYSASVTYESEPGLATVSISGSTLTVDINDATEGGNAVIEVTASDGTVLQLTLSI